MLHMVDSVYIPLSSSHQEAGGRLLLLLLLGKVLNIGEAVSSSYSARFSPKRQPYIFTMVLFAFLDGDDNQSRLNRIMLIILLLQYHNSIRHRHYLLRSAVLPPLFSWELGRWEFDGAFLASDEEEDAFVQDIVDQGFPWSGDAYGTFVGPITK
jgi:hypothetical protein